jgi:hypothetical protein
VERGLVLAPIHLTLRKVDHAVLVLESAGQVDRAVAAMVRAGGSVVEEPHVFPVDGCPDAPFDPAIGKYMATVALSRGLLVLAAPHRPGDQLSRHLDRWGPDVPHHVALRVRDVAETLPSWTRTGYRAGPIVDDGELTQVFLSSPTGQIVELIARRSLENLATFSCPNVAALSNTETQLTKENHP